MKHFAYALFCVALLNASVKAAVLTSVGDPEGTGLWTAEAQTFTYPIPALQTTVNEGNFNPTVGQSFKSNSGGFLKNVQIFIDGGPSLYDMHLYNQGTSDPGSTYSRTNDVLPASTQFQFFGDANKKVRLIDTTSLGLVPIVANNYYVLEFVAAGGTPQTNAMIWWRGSAADSASGHAYRGLGLINGLERDFGMAVTTFEVPEPASMALLGCSLVSTLFIRKR